MLNPNERDASLVSLFISEGQYVKKDEILCTLETTKSVSDIYAERDGYVIGLMLAPNQSVTVGDTLCYIATQPDWKPTQKKIELNDRTTPSELPPGLRITNPALALAQQDNLDLRILPTDRLVTQDIVQKYLKHSSLPALADFNINILGKPETAVVIYGGGGHGKSLIELINAMGTYQIIGVIDDGFPVGTKILGYPVLGDNQVLPALFNLGVQHAINAIGGIDNLNSRIEAFNRLREAGFTCPVVTHPTAFVEKSATIEPGTQIFAHAYVGSDALINFGCIINTGAIVSHDCVLGKYVNLSPGATLAGRVQLADSVLVGMQATVNINVVIGTRVRIGNGATVKAAVPEGGIVRAGTAWPK